ncbi:growth/differentiation factor 8 [Elysia marginata]|uniref:Growth/differentiation factor 8 n=1 Tax=Elysia marginata TaxID=1093978 RepID=A0AAV4HY06_9GAST|nr:growth/differentiation factor 8 [Elysia marginata]
MLLATDFPEQLSLNITDGVYFTLPSQVKTSKIKRAHLWVYIKRPASPITQKFVELSIVQIAPETKTSERVVHKPIETKKLHIGKRHKPWRQIDFKRVLEFWTKRPELNFGVRITALDASGNNLVVLPPDDEYAPLIMVSLGKGASHSRHRRSQSLVCTENSQETRCCRYPLEIGFVELGWEWIIAPVYVRADYCAGDCRMAMLDDTPRSWITQQIHVEDAIGSCCVPTRMQPLSLLYFDDDNNILYQILQNVKVSKCGCV